MNQGNHVISLPFFPIHEYLAMLWDQGYEQFSESCFSADGHNCLQRFWRHVGHMEWAKDHPAQDDQSRLPYTIPAAMFGDDARLYKADKMLCWQFSMMLSRAKAVVTKFVVCVMPWYLITKDTIEDINRVLVWMWECALEGTYALYDHLGHPITRKHGAHRFSQAGKPLCAGEPRYRLSLAAMKLDLQFEKYMFDFPTYDQIEMCKSCFASKRDGDMLYSRTGRDAPWRRRPRTTQQYLTSGKILPSLVLIPGWSLGLHRNDPMHVIFLGFGLHLIGSVLLDLASRNHWPGRSRKDQLLQAWLDMRAWTKRLGLQCSQSRFTAGSLSQGKKVSFGELKGKAHNCRVMLSWLADVCYHSMGKYGDHGELLATATWSLDDVCYAIDQNRDWAVRDADAERIYNRGHTFLVTYKALAVWALESKPPRKLFAWRPKLHYFEHLLDTIVTEKLSFHALWNFAEEDLIGSTIKVSHRSHRMTVMERTLDRLYVRMGLAFAGRDKAPVGMPPWFEGVL